MRERSMTASLKCPQTYIYKHAHLMLSPTLSHTHNAHSPHTHAACTLETSLPPCLLGHFTDAFFLLQNEFKLIKE